MKNKLMMYFLIVQSCLLITMTGCGIKEIKKQVEEVEFPGLIKGKIKITSDQKGSVIVLKYRDVKGVPSLESSVIASWNGKYRFRVKPGKFYIGAFIDVNNDGERQPGEHGNFHGIPSIIDVSAKQIEALETITISGPVPKPDTTVKPVNKVRAAWNNIGRVTSLDDPRFTRDNYDLGFWKPFDFLDVAEGGLFFLQEYQPKKVPVLFIHGVKGGPTDWNSVIESLDKDRFQPWVFYYPSGLRLDTISDFLLEAVSRLKLRYDFSGYHIIAHSMGGLVARSFVKKYIEHSPGNSKTLRLVMTINSPMNGMPAAAAGVKHSPIVIPSWRDVEPVSDFMAVLNQWNWPREIPYHLVISYTDGESGDGVVPLQSQVPLKLQSESTGMYVFNNDHVGTLHDKNFLDLFNNILKKNIKK